MMLALSIFWFVLISCGLESNAVVTGSSLSCILSNPLHSAKGTGIIITSIFTSTAPRVPVNTLQTAKQNYKMIWLQHTPAKEKSRAVREEAMVACASRLCNVCGRECTEEAFLVFLSVTLSCCYLLSSKSMARQKQTETATRHSYWITGYCPLFDVIHLLSPQSWIKM